MASFGSLPQVALPIEYGALNVCNMLSGLLLYGEGRHMQGWQITMAVSGGATILLGIAISRLHPKRFRLAGAVLRGSYSDEATREH